MDTTTATDNPDRDRIRKYYMVMFVMKAGLGIGLIICGTQGVRYTKGQDTFDPPYYVGAFIAGSLLTLASPFAIVVYRKLNSFDESSYLDKKSIGQYVSAEIALTILAAFSCLIGITFVGAFGLKNCDNPKSFAHGCNYTENISQNRSLAVIILIGLLMTVAVGIFSVCSTCCSTRLSVIKALGRTSFRFNARSAPVITHQRTATGAAETQSHYHYPTVTVGAVGAQPDSNYAASAPGSMGSGAQPTDAQIRNLEEQNRLLREQLELQTRLYQQQQQQQYTQGGMPGPVYPSPPPPSYSECVSDAKKDDVGNGGTDMLTSSGGPAQPSAPPL